MFAKYIGLAGLALMLSGGIASAEPALVTADLNVRGGPGTQYPVIGQIPGGTTVDARDCTEWCRVEGGGFVNGAYLDFGDDGPSPVYAGPPVYVGPAPIFVPGPVFGPRFYGRGFYRGGYHGGFHRHWR